MLQLRARHVPSEDLDLDRCVSRTALSQIRNGLVRRDLQIRWGQSGRFAGLLGVDRDRVRLWTFARAAAEPRDDWTDAAHTRAVAS